MKGCEWFIYGFGLCAAINTVLVFKLYEPKVAYTVEYQVLSHPGDDIGAIPLKTADVERLI